MCFKFNLMEVMISSFSIGVLFNDGFGVFRAWKCHGHQMIF